MHIKFSKINILTVLSALFLFTVLLPLGAMAADNAKTVITIPDNAKLVRLVAEIGKVSLSDSTIDIAEELVLVTAYRTNSETRQTFLVDPQKHVITLAAFEEGQLVKVMGFRLPDGRIVAESVVQLGPRKVNSAKVKPLSTLTPVR